MVVVLVAKVCSELARFCNLLFGTSWAATATALMSIKNKPRGVSSSGMSTFNIGLLTVLIWQLMMARSALMSVMDTMNVVPAGTIDTFSFIIYWDYQCMFTLKGSPISKLKSDLAFYPGDLFSDFFTKAIHQF